MAKKSLFSCFCKAKKAALFLLRNRHSNAFPFTLSN